MLTDEDRDLFRTIAEPTQVDGVFAYRPGVAKDLAEMAWTLKDDNYVAGAGIEWFDPFIERAGGGKLIRYGVQHNRPGTQVHVDSWGIDASTIPNLFTVLMCFRRGEYTGNEYVLIDYGVAFDFQDGDLLVATTAARHANLPQHGKELDRLCVTLCLEREGLLRGNCFGAEI